MGIITRKTGNGNSLSDVIGTYINKMEPFEPASYTLCSASDETTIGTRHSMARLVHSYDSLDQLAGRPGVVEYRVNASA